MRAGQVGGWEHKGSMYQVRGLGQDHRAIETAFEHFFSAYILDIADLVSRGSQGLRSPLESRRGSLGAP